MLNKKFPKISIVTVNYNEGRFLEQTIKSVLDQNYPNLEYIIVDGGSSDNSLEIIKKYEEKLAYWISEPDDGMYFGLQKGFQKATGEILAWINADDLYHPKAFFTVGEIFQSFSDVLWLTGFNTNFNEEGRCVFCRKPLIRTKYDHYIMHNSHIQQESTFFSRKLWNLCGGYISTDYKYAGDYELWNRFF